MFKANLFLSVILLFPAWSAAADAPPSPKGTPVSTPARPPRDRSPRAAPSVSKSFVFRHRKTAGSLTGDPLDTGSSLETPFLPDREAYYDRLNADLSPCLTNRPAALTSTEKVLGTVLGAASYACAGIAAAQSMGLLPSGKEKKKK